MKQKRYLPLAAVAAASMAFASGCATQEAAQTMPPQQQRPAIAQSAPSGGPGGPMMGRGGSGAPAGSGQEAFLARIRQAGAGNGVVTDARMRGDGELGIVLGRGVKLSEVKPLLTVMLKEMRDAFPNRPLTVRAYAPNNQPMAVMRYDPSAPANSNVTYTTNFKTNAG